MNTLFGRQYMIGSILIKTVDLNTCQILSTTAFGLAA